MLKDGPWSAIRSAKASICKCSDSCLLHYPDACNVSLLLLLLLKIRTKSATFSGKYSQELVCFGWSSAR